MVNNIFPTVYRASSSLVVNEIMFPKEARRKWEEFRAAYNGVLHDWKRFMEHVAQAISYGATIQAESVKDIPQKD